MEQKKKNVEERTAMEKTIERSANSSIVSTNFDIVVHTTCYRNFDGNVSVGEFFGDNHPLNFSQIVEGTQSKSFTQIKAVQLALEKILAWNKFDKQLVLIRTDHRELIEAVNGKVRIAFKYRAEVREIQELAAKFKKGVVFEHVYNQDGHYGYESAVKLAKAEFKCFENTERNQCKQGSISNHAPPTESEQEAQPPRAVILPGSVPVDRSIYFTKPIIPPRTTQVLSTKCQTKKSQRKETSPKVRTAHTQSNKSDENSDKANNSLKMETHIWKEATFQKGNSKSEEYKSNKSKFLQRMFGSRSEKPTNLGQYQRSWSANRPTRPPQQHRCSCGYHRCQCE